MLNGLLSMVTVGTPLAFAVSETPAYRAMIEKSGSVPVSSSPTQMQAVIDAAVRDAAPIITEFGLQVD